QLSSPPSSSAARVAGENVVPPSIDVDAAISFPICAPKTAKTSRTFPFGRVTTWTPFAIAGARCASTGAGADHVRPPSDEWRVSIVSREKFMYETEHRPRNRLGAQLSQATPSLS